MFADLQAFFGLCFMLLPSEPDFFSLKHCHREEGSGMLLPLVFTVSIYVEV